MFRVRREDTALDELTVLWMAANSGLRQLITAAGHQIDLHLQTDPWIQAESRPQGRRILFVCPLGVTHRMEADGQTVSLLRIWLFRGRGK